MTSGGATSPAGDLCASPAWFKVSEGASWPRCRGGVKRRKKKKGVVAFLIGQLDLKGNQHVSDSLEEEEKTRNSLDAMSSRADGANDMRRLSIASV